MGNARRQGRPHAPIAYVCCDCGSDEVKRDAWIAWNADAQLWEVANAFDDGWCDNCGGEARLVAVAAIELASAGP